MVSPSQSALPVNTHKTQHLLRLRLQGRPTHFIKRK